MLQVNKDRFAAGIWKPVIIGVVEQPESPPQKHPAIE